MNRAAIIRRITNELGHLSASDLEKVHEQIRQLRERPTDEAPSSQPPFVDEIERVKEQTRDIPGTDEEKHFT